MNQIPTEIALLYPRKLVFGVNCFGQFATDYLATGLKRLFIVTIPFMEERLATALKPLREAGVSLKINCAIQGEPALADFEAVLADARSFGADSVAGIGGGSVLDVSKLLAAQLLNGQATTEVMGKGNLRGRDAYLACIPTTAGTGSEVSPNALFIDEKGGKVAVISPFLLPDASYVDPSLTATVPAAITASTGIDALAHCMEAYTNRFSHPMVDLIALEGVRLIFAYLKRACEDGNDLEARTQVALGSLYGGMCLGPVNTAAAHALAYPLGTDFHVPHGLSVALLLPFVMEYNLPAATERYARLAAVMGAGNSADDTETAAWGVNLIRELISSCGLPSSLSQIGIPVEAVGKMAEDALNIQRLLKNNPRELTKKDAEAIYRAAFSDS